MSSLTELQAAIEKMRTELHALVEDKHGNLADPEVTRMSQELDELIVKHCHLKAAVNMKRS